MTDEPFAGHFPFAVRTAGRPLDAAERVASVAATEKVELLAAPGSLAAAKVANPAH